MKTKIEKILEKYSENLSAEYGTSSMGISEHKFEFVINEIMDIINPMKEETILRENLMNDVNYSAFCGSMECPLEMPKSTFNKKRQQFICGCGAISIFPIEFIQRYKRKHKIN